MPPKSTKQKKRKEADTAPKKQSSRAAKRAHAPAALQQDLVVTEEECTGDAAHTGSLQGMVNCVDNMMAIILELSQKVHGPDKTAAEKTGIHLTSTSGSKLVRKRARHHLRASHACLSHIYLV